MYKEYKEYHECTEEEQKLIKNQLASLANSKWVEISFCEQYIYLLNNYMIVDLIKKKGK